MNNYAELNNEQVESRLAHVSPEEMAPEQIFTEDAPPSEHALAMMSLHASIRAEVEAAQAAIAADLAERS